MASAGSFSVQIQASTLPGEVISATATDAAGDTSEFCQDVTAAEVDPVTASDLLAILSNPQQVGAVTLQATSNNDVTAAIGAVNGVTNPNPGTPMTVTLDLGGGTYTTDTHVSTHAWSDARHHQWDPRRRVARFDRQLGRRRARRRDRSQRDQRPDDPRQRRLAEGPQQHDPGVRPASTRPRSWSPPDLGPGHDFGPGKNTINVNGAGQLVLNTT